jgi:hypothetical protein
MPLVAALIDCEAARVSSWCLQRKDTPRDDRRGAQTSYSKLFAAWLFVRG